MLLLECWIEQVWSIKYGQVAKYGTGSESLGPLRLLGPLELSDTGSLLERFPAVAEGHAFDLHA